MQGSQAFVCLETLCCMRWDGKFDTKVELRRLIADTDGLVRGKCEEKEIQK